MIVAVVFAGLYFKFVLVEDGKGTANLSFNSSRMKSVLADADLPADTLNTLAEKSATIEDKFKNVEETASESSKEVRELKAMMKQMMTNNSQLQEKIDEQNREMIAVQNAVTNNNNKTVDFESLRESLVEAVTGNIATMLPTETQTEYPISPESQSTEPAVEPETTSRIRSYGVPVDKDGNVPKAYLNQLDQSSTTDVDSASDTATVKPPTVVVDPRFTIPADAVLVDSVTITALIGRIPKGGNINKEEVIYT